MTTYLLLVSRVLPGYSNHGTVKDQCSRVGSRAGAVAKGSVSSPRPSNRARGSPAHGSPTFFTVGVRPVPARAGTAWGR
jgi:hypothetical protein